MIFLFSSIGIFSFGGFLASLFSEKLGIVFIGIISIGFFLIPAAPLMIEFCCELSYPVGEASSVGFMDAFLKLSAFFVGTFVSFVAKGSKKAESVESLILLIEFMILGLLFFSLVDEDLRKLKADLASSPASIQS